LKNILNKFEISGRERVIFTAGPVRHGNKSMEAMEKLKEENARLKSELDHCKKMVSGYENVLKLNEMELANARTIINMYETIIEYGRSELKLATETAKARENASQLSRLELMEAFEKIKELEEQNRVLRGKRNGV